MLRTIKATGFYFLMILIVLNVFDLRDLSAQERVVKGYYMYWSKGTLPADELPWSELTHVANAFIWPDENGNLVISQAEHPELVERAIEEGVVPVISVGGWGQSDAFPVIAADSELRSVFNQNLVDYIVERGYMGIDLDWEYPGAADRQNLTYLVGELHQLLSEQDELFEISMALPSIDWQNGYDVQALGNYVDWFGLMTYDFHGAWTDRAGHNSPLYSPSSAQCNTGSMHQSVQHYLQKGVPRDKIVAGLASYGRQFNSGEVCGLVTESSGNGAAVPYHEAVNRMENGWSREWDSTSSAVYLLNSDSTRIVTFDDTTTFRLKSEYIIENSLRGAMVWALGYDRIDTGHPLMEVLGELRGQAVSIELSESVIPEGIYLEQNYPNPFNPETNIRFQLSEQSEITLSVYDMAGRRVSVLDQSVRQSGTHTVYFDASAFSSGVYIYRLSADGINLTRKMTLMK